MSLLCQNFDWLIMSQSVLWANILSYHGKMQATACSALLFLAFLQASLGEWLSSIGLSQYHQMLVQNGYENIDFITDITWEDLQEIGITKLGTTNKQCSACFVFPL